MVAATGAGPSPIPRKSLTSENLADAIAYCLTPKASAAAIAMSTTMKRESGVRSAVQSFLANLPPTIIKCDLIASQPAAFLYRLGKTHYRLSKAAAGILTSYSLIDSKDLEL